MSSGLALTGGGLSITGGSPTAADITVGTTTVTGGANGDVLIKSGGTVGSVTPTGTGAPMFNIGPTLGSVAFASLPAAGTAGRIYRVSNAGTKGSYWADDGTRWKPVNGEAYLASLDTTSASIGNTETIVFQYLMPIGLWQLKDVLRLAVTGTKSGTTDGTTMRIHVGPLGTTSDPQLASLSFMGTTTVQGAAIMDIRLETATTMLLLPITATALGYSGNTVATGVAFPAAVTITSAATTALFVSVAVLSTGASNTSAVVSAQLSLRSSAN